MDDQDHDSQDHITHDHKGTELTELAVGAVDHCTHDGIGDTVPQTDGGGDDTDDENTEPGNIGCVVADVHHQEHVGVRCRVVHCKTSDLPWFCAVILLLLHLDPPIHILDIIIVAYLFAGCIF